MTFWRVWKHLKATTAQSTNIPHSRSRMVVKRLATNDSLSLEVWLTPVSTTRRGADGALGEKKTLASCPTRINVFWVRRLADLVCVCVCSKGNRICSPAKKERNVFFLFGVVVNDHIFFQKNANLESFSQYFFRVLCRVVNTTTWFASSKIFRGFHSTDRARSWILWRTHPVPRTKVMLRVRLNGVSGREWRWSNYEKLTWVSPLPLRRYQLWGGWCHPKDIGPGVWCDGVVGQKNVKNGKWPRILIFEYKPARFELGNLVTKIRFVMLYIVLTFVCKQSA